MIGHGASRVVPHRFKGDDDLSGRQYAYGTHVVDNPQDIVMRDALGLGEAAHTPVFLSGVPIRAGWRGQEQRNPPNSVPGAWIDRTLPPPRHLDPELQPEAPSQAGPAGCTCQGQSVPLRTAGPAPQIGNATQTSCPAARAWKVRSIRSCR